MRTVAIFGLLLCAVASSRAEEGRKPDLLGPNQPQPCVQKSAQGYKEPDSLQTLLDCQFKFRIGWVRRFNERLGTPPTNASLDKLDDLQRAEVREYLSRHPDRAHTDYDASDEPSSDEPKKWSLAAGGKAAPKDCRPPSSMSAEKPSDPNGEFAKQRERTKVAMDSNLDGRDANVKKDLAALDSSLAKKSDEGRAGITQDGALQIVEYLECEQGGVSDDMTDLLNHVVRDGGKLQHDTVLRLKQAARQAQENGLELGVDSDMEKWLLDPKTDPPDDPNGPNPTAGTNVN